MAQDLAPAIEELKIALGTVENNAPINEREGNKDQANLERTNAGSYKAAIKALKYRFFPTREQTKRLRSNG